MFKNSHLRILPLLAAVTIGLAVAAASVMMARSSNEGGEGSKGLADPQGTGPSIAEYNAAVEATVACINAAGGVADLIPGSGLRPNRYSYRVPAANGDSGPPDAAVMASAEGCAGDILSAVQQAYVLAQPGPSEQDIEGIFAYLDACIDGGGVPGIELSEHPMSISTEYEGHSLAVSTEEIDAYRECALELEALTGFVPPLPETR